MTERVALFDLDSTLLDCNSGRLWMIHEWKAGRIGVRDVAWASWVLARYALGADGLEEAYAAAVASLQGQEEQALHERTRRWFEAEVGHRLRPGAREALRQHRERGDRLVLATSSSPYAAGAAIAAFALDDAISTVFEVEDGRFTGRISASAFGAAKAERVAEWAEREGVDLGLATFYTDSVTDAALLERVGTPVCVNPDRRLRRLAEARGWSIVDWGKAT